MGLGAPPLTNRNNLNAEVGFVTSCRDTGGIRALTLAALEALRATGAKVSKQQVNAEADFARVALTAIHTLIQRCTPYNSDRSSNNSSNNSSSRLDSSTLFDSPTIPEHTPICTPVQSVGSPPTSLTSIAEFQRAGGALVILAALRCGRQSLVDLALTIIETAISQQGVTTLTFSALSTIEPPERGQFYVYHPNTRHYSLAAPSSSVLPCLRMVLHRIMYNYSLQIISI